MQAVYSSAVAKRPRDASCLSVVSSSSAVFYRATPMHSADYAVARCPSVCHTPVLSLNG